MSATASEAYDAGDAPDAVTEVDASLGTVSPEQPYFPQRLEDKKRSDEDVYPDWLKGILREGYGDPWADHTNYDSTVVDEDVTLLPEVFGSDDDVELPEMYDDLEDVSDDAESDDWAYDVLGLSSDASVEAVESRYRDLVKEYHPDVGGDEEVFKEITEAYDRLT